jgi:hypothetical protein
MSEHTQTAVVPEAIDLPNGDEGMMMSWMLICAQQECGCTITVNAERNHCRGGNPQLEFTKEGDDDCAVVIEEWNSAAVKYKVHVRNEDGDFDSTDVATDEDAFQMAYIGLTE